MKNIDHRDEILPSDGGPVYFETNLENWVAEPWNTVTAFMFLLIAAFWVRKLVLDGKMKQVFLRFAVPMLAIGGLGGTLYHALRTDFWLMMMDWLPILLLILGCSAYFLRLVSGAWWKAFAYILAAFVFLAVVSWVIPNHQDALKTNLTYFIQFMIVLLPTVLVLKKTRFKYSVYVFVASGSFALALFFRIADPWGWIPMGTHFLWHVFGACACQMMFVYIYRLDKNKAVFRDMGRQ
ncbi:hypothetical protein FUAX_12110 [Fulvitalea axinellae]|uniref:Ceramidase n=1 Tax=Fulvitalea axinellae TaxID=1182444 RepID=A0AAU9D324_9BACT|nr:hypothetical protein FUAX_12110 [Fulvitalea axinellae]